MPLSTPSLRRRTFLGLGAVGLLAAAGCGPSPAAAPTPAPWQRRLLGGTDGTPREVGFLGDSIAFGGGAYGSTAPKYLNSFVGRLRTALEPTYGSAGTGWVFANHALWPETDANRGWDPRLRVVGAVAKAPAGLFRHTCARIPATRRGATPSAYVELQAEGTTFSTLVVGQASGRSRQLVSVDGGKPLVLANVWRGSGSPDVAPREGTAPRHLVTEVPTGAPGTHTVRVWAEGGPVDLVALRADTGTGRLAVTSAAVSGESLATFCGPGADDETGGTTGLPYVDTLAFDLLVVELGANDYNAGRPLEETRALLVAVVQRQRARGGDVALVFPPISTPQLYPGNGAPTYDAYAGMVGEVAAAEGAPFLDLTHVWGRTFEESAALRPPRYADGIHPSDDGAADIAARCRTFLGL